MTKTKEAAIDAAGARAQVKGYAAQEATGG
jgi:hypothetical protein